MTIRDIAVAFGFEVDHNSEAEAERSIQDLKNLATRLLGKIAIVFGIHGLKEFASECVAMASNVEEMQNKFDTVFQGITEEVEQWADNYAETVGRNRNTIKRYLSDQQNLLVGFANAFVESGEMTEEAARRWSAQMSEDMTSLALDIASFANTDEDLAVNYMTKAVMGQTEAARGLGAVLNDVTRAQAMAALGLQGSYDKLSQLEKMQVNYQAILSQSPDAIGDCIRSMDSYEAAQRRQNAALAEFKELIGGQLLPIFTVFTNLTTGVIKKGKDFAQAILGTSEETNHLLHGFERLQALAKRLQPLMERFFQSLSGRGKQTVETVKRLAERFGGMENLLKILAAAAAALLLILNWGKIAGAVQGIIQLLGKALGLLNLGTLKIAAIVGAVALLALVVEDFVQFMLGNDSVIGAAFEQAGIDAEEMRQKIVDIWENLKSYFSGLMEQIQGILGPAIDWIMEKLSSVFGIDLSFEGLGDGLAGILDFLDRLTGAAAESEGFQKAMAAVIVVVLALIAALNIAGPVIALVTGLLSAMGAVIAFLTSPIGIAIAAIAALIAIGVLLYQHWDEVRARASEIWENLSQAVKGKIDSVQQTIRNGIQAAVDFITGLPSQALQWGADLIGGLVKGITSKIGAVKDAVSGVAEKIRSFLHFSVPDEGPLTDYESWMPDFMGALADGMNGGAAALDSAVASIGNRIKGGFTEALAEARTAYDAITALGQASAVKAKTAATTTVSSRVSNVTQNVNIDNTYNGGSVEAQKNVSKAMKKSASDATDYMARGLVYAR